MSTPATLACAVIASLWFVSAIADRPSERGAAGPVFSVHDLDRDGFEDLIASTPSGTTVALFKDFDHGWSRVMLNVPRSSDRALPVITILSQSSLGFWFLLVMICN